MLIIKKLLLILLLIANISTMLQAEHKAIILRVTEITTLDKYYDTWHQIYTKAEYDSDALKYYDAIYWKQREEMRFYEFSDDYDASFCASHKKGDKTDQECINYREQYSIQDNDVSGFGSEAISEKVADAYEIFTAMLAQKHPNAKHGLMFSGHGSPGGKLFHGLLYPAHAQKVLKDWSEELGKKLAFVDMGGPCNKGSYGDLNMLCPFTDYYIASDLPNSSFYPNKEYTDEDYSNDGGIANTQVQYHNIFRQNQTLLTSMKQRIAVTQFSFDRSSDYITDLKNDTVKPGYPDFLDYQQANYLYSCQNFKKLYDKVNNDNIISSTSVDLRNYFTGKYEEPKRSEVYTLFDDTIIDRADTRDIAEWVEEADTNGMLAAARTNASGNNKLTYPIIEYPNSNDDTSKVNITPIISYLLSN